MGKAWPTKLLFDANVFIAFFATSSLSCNLAGCCSDCSNMGATLAAAVALLPLLLLLPLPLPLLALLLLLLSIIVSMPVDTVPGDGDVIPGCKPHTAKKASNVHLNRVAGLAKPGLVYNRVMWHGIYIRVCERCVKGCVGGSRCRYVSGYTFIR